MQDAVHAYMHSMRRTMKRMSTEVTPSPANDMRQEMNQRTKLAKGKEDIRVKETVPFSKVIRVFERLFSDLD